MNNLINTDISEHTPENYYLPLRGDNINNMIDAASPLLGMILRLKEVDTTAMPENLYQQTVTDIQSIEQLLREYGYELGTIISFRYVLCTFIDEIALSHGWGANNTWYKKSLLTHFHNETWGGEKVYILLDKLMSEPDKYNDLLEFMYLCFSLGFRGRYKINNFNGEFEGVYKRLYELITLRKSNASKEIVIHHGNNEKSRYLLDKKITIRKVLIYGSVALVAIYSIYFMKLEHQTSIILEQLNNLLN